MTDVDRARLDELVGDGYHTIATRGR